MALYCTKHRDTELKKLKGHYYCPVCQPNPVFNPKKVPGGGGG